MAKEFWGKLLTNTSENGDGGEYLHLDGGGGYSTLCGWCDVTGVEDAYSSDVDRPLCPQCLDVLSVARRYTRTMIKT